MVLPLFKLGLVAYKAISKPLVGVIKDYVKNNTNRKEIFIWLGLKANRFELILDRKFINPNIKIDDMRIKPINDHLAFHKGVDFFIEIFFLYGLVLGLTFYEVKRSYVSSNKAKAKQKKIEDAIIENEHMIQEVQLLISENQKALERVKTSEEALREEFDARLQDIDLKLDKLLKKVL